MSKNPNASPNSGTITAVTIACLIAVLSMATHVRAQGTIEPPTLGQETKGTPAFDETATKDEEADVVSESQEQEKPSNSIFGTAKVTESKRESGQIYLIELEHSSGSKQYIEETDSDGKIESTSNDIEETPNLPKWKIGSW